MASKPVNLKDWSITKFITHMTPTHLPSSQPKSLGTTFVMMGSIFQYTFQKKCPLPTQSRLRMPFLPI